MMETDNELESLLSITLDVQPHQWSLSPIEGVALFSFNPIDQSRPLLLAVLMAHILFRKWDVNASMHQLERFRIFFQVK
jgi:hypothetical protein